MSPSNIATPVYFNATRTPQTYTLSLHDALPISLGARQLPPARCRDRRAESFARRHRVDPAAHRGGLGAGRRFPRARSEEHTSELQSRGHIVCRLSLEKK